MLAFFIFFFLVMIDEYAPDLTIKQVIYYLDISCDLSLDLKLPALCL